ncbi:serine/threonine-protein kinase [Microcoleus sp. FACHB-68]|uniref:serine/threonine-protein kinase n=1 Tax=Microcoleus sp. FACHB-68 TaxID=2692826 RepID=UPI001682B550|nr:serine/threonine-protein kinase [Microcoleus sp. FACHB-68]MBD1937763.1 pentapeptide repeat-containing protein [Microcoleus sp. FACHB-68]
MSYCVNPACPHPENPDNALRCQACGEKLLLRDRYRVTQALGQGGFGATFIAQDISLPGQPTSVIKQLRPVASSERVLEMAKELFEREAKTLGKIGNHPQVPRLLDYFDTNDQFYLVQEYVSGATLKQEVKRSGPLTELGVRQFLTEILPVVQYLHDHRVIHRDIKPANIIRRTIDHKLVLIDFGAVKDQVSQTALMSTSDQTALTSFAIGTPGFAPPEQMALRPVYASDIYAVGVTCIYLLTGKSPNHLGYDPITGEIRWREYINVSSRLVNVLEKMLEVSVRLRYQSANDVLRALAVEFHRESLSQGMINQPKSSGTLSDEPTDIESGGGGAGGSQVSRLAEAIRARKGRSGGTRVPIRDSRNPGMVSKAAAATTVDGKGASSAKMKGPIKWDAIGVKTAYTKGRRDFAACDLNLLDLSRTSLAEAIFHQASLVKTKFLASDLSNANFGRASLNQAVLRDANLTKAYMSYANLEGADMRGADLSEAYLTHANLRGANLCGANLTGARVSDEQLATAKTNWMTVRPNGKRGLF